MAYSGNKVYSTAPGERIVVYNSQDRFNVNDLTSKIQGRLDAPLKGVTRVTLHSAIIPHSWYNISAQLENNSLVILNDDELVTVTLPSGNYTFDTFASMLESVFNDQLAGTWTVTKDQPPDSTNGAYNYRLIIDCDAGWSIPAVDGTPTDPIPESYKLLGLGASGLSAGAPPYTATTGVICLNPVRGLFIGHSRCKDLASNSFDPHFKSQFFIPVTGIFGSLELYQMKEGAFNTVTLSGVDNLLSDYTIQLLDQDGALVDLNGQDWTVSFMYTEQLKPNVREEIDYGNFNLPPSKRQRVF